MKLSELRQIIREEVKDWNSNALLKKALNYLEQVGGGEGPVEDEKIEFLKPFFKKYNFTVNDGRDIYLYFFRKKAVNMKDADLAKFLKELRAEVKKFDKYWDDKIAKFRAKK